MITWRDITRTHRANLSWTAKQIADHLGCSREQVHSCKQRHNLKIPRERRRTDNPDNVIALGRQARRAGLSVSDLAGIADRRFHPKLSAQDVAEIEALYTGAVGQKTALARKYGVSPDTIARVLDGTYWNQFVVIPKQEAAE